MKTGANISINTLRRLADRIWGENRYSLEEDYRKTKSTKPGSAANWKKIYTLNGKDWKTCREMVATLTAICEKTGR